MKFRTEIVPGPYPFRLGYANRILSLGSCFADEMARRLAQAKFRIEANPAGVLFNPGSIARTLLRAAAGETVAETELRHSDEGLWFHYGFHGNFSDADPSRACAGMNDALRRLGEWLAAADCVMVTFGTAWVYELLETGEPVANCHRQPKRLFRRRRLAVEEIVARWRELLAGPISGKRTIFTVSPVRHLGDGLEGDSLSKATLRVAIEELTASFPDACYFPAYEALTDDLRDYRFYADDLVHPSSQAVEYVWEKFSGALLTPEARTLADEVFAAVADARHRPLHGRSDAYRAFVRTALARIERLQSLTGGDFSREKALLAGDRTE